MKYRAEAVIRACCLALLGFATDCSVYDPHLLPAPSQEGPQLSGGASGAGGRTGDAGAIDTDCVGNSASPICTRPHADATCVSGKCLIAGCKAPYVDCDQNDDNGCETTLETPENCGLCGAACRFSHAAGSCNDGRCSLGGCEDGYADCDGDDSNGCETSLASTDNCGGCGTACTAAAHALAGCKDGACGVASCVGAFGDCNGDPKDGCEQALDSVDHCGQCNARCAPANTTNPSCAGAHCAVGSCTAPFADCNGLASDGCESRLDSSDDCGACGAKCSLPHVTKTTCQSANGKSSCGIDHGCAPDATGCKPGDAANGCEPGWSDCDGKPANGCEADLTRLTSCGSCGQSCVLANSKRACSNGQCSTVGCAPGYDRCSGATSCASLLDDPKNCGQCGQQCGGGQPNCAGGKCTNANCVMGTADCDSNNLTCETNVAADANNCGECGNRCNTLPNVDTASCDSGTCQITNCRSGFADCDGDVTNGCEVNLNSASDCGACGTSCSSPGAQATCNGRRCQITQCPANRADCNRSADDGCESDLRLPTTCGACGVSCSNLPNVASSSCVESTCNIVCQPGRADCDKRTDNGCEADLTNASSCGACGRNCASLAHVSSADCVAGACTNVRCDAGYADCNGDPNDGCERAINTATDCGRCNQACAPAHATGSCIVGLCAVLNCDPGFGDCDANGSNGCETSLSTADHCGACGTVCPNGATCQNGMCGCTADSQCPSGQSCCNGTCTANVGACFPFPCVPGTDLGQNRLNCGGCNMPCLLWCCSVPPK